MGCSGSRGGLASHPEARSHGLAGQQVSLTTARIGKADRNINPDDDKPAAGVGQGHQLTDGGGEVGRDLLAVENNTVELGLLW